jgi:hypothetical protein
MSASLYGILCNSQWKEPTDLFSYKKKWKVCGEESLNHIKQHLCFSHLIKQMLLCYRGIQRLHCGGTDEEGRHNPWSDSIRRN